ncbi:MAG: hypothetical protein ABJA80_12185 [bacterium]
MSDTRQPSLDLSSLASDYEIVGEVSGSRDARTYMATRKQSGAGKRRDDSPAVVISVVTPPSGDEGNALSHLAADTKLLAGTSHRRLLPVIEGRWIGKDAFAVITQRTTDPSVADRLAQGEKFSTTRVAAILREVNGLLEWARDHNVIHRAVTADHLYLEPKTDRVRIAFSVSPIRRIQQSDAATDDARTIVRLAMAMLTGIEDPSSYDGRTLAELRPELPKRLHEATASLLEEKRVHTPADVAAFLAMVGMADPLYAGETEAERIRAEVLEEQRVEREKLAGERSEFERLMAEQRATFEKHMADERAAHERQREEERLAHEKLRDDEHAAFEKVKNTERDRAAKEKEELQRAVEAERAALVARRAELERSIATQRKELERVAAEDRRSIDALRAELKAAGEAEIERKREAALEDVTDAESSLDQEEFNTPAFLGPMLVPLEAFEFDDDTALMRDDPIVDEPIVVPVAAASAGTGIASTVDGAAVPVVVAGTPSSRRRWIIPAVAALVIILAVTALALGRGWTTRAPAAAPVAMKPAPAVVPPAVVATPPSAAVLDSSAGAITSPPATAALTGAPTTAAATAAKSVASSPGTTSAPTTPNSGGAAPGATTTPASATPAPGATGTALADSAIAAAAARRRAAEAKAAAVAREEARAATASRARRLAADSVARGNGTPSNDSMPVFRDVSPRKRDTTVVKPASIPR